MSVLDRAIAKASIAPPPVTPVPAAVPTPVRAPAAVLPEQPAGQRTSLRELLQFQSATTVQAGPESQRYETARPMLTAADTISVLPPSVPVGVAQHDSTQRLAVPDLAAPVSAAPVPVAPALVEELTPEPLPVWELDTPPVTKRNAALPVTVPAPAVETPAALEIPVATEHLEHATDQQTDSLSSASVLDLPPEIESTVEAESVSESSAPDCGPSTPEVPEPSVAVAEPHWPEICERLLQFTGNGFTELARQLTLIGAQGRKCLGFVSHARQTGRTSVVLTLARVYADQQDARVLVIDADHEHPQIAELMGLTTEHDLAQVLTGRCDTESAVRSLPAGSVSLLPLQQPLHERDWKASAGRIRELLQSVRANYDLVLVDAGVCPVDIKLAESWMRDSLDAVITVARERPTTRRGEPEPVYPNWSQIGIESLGVIETFA